MPPQLRKIIDVIGIQAKPIVDEIRTTIAKAGAAANERHAGAAEQQRAIAAAVNRLAEELVTYQKNQNAADARRECRERKTLRALRASFACSLLLAAFSVVSTIAAVVSTKAARDAAGAAITSADAAMKQVNLMQYDQRPWVALTPFIDGDLTHDNLGDAFFYLRFTFEALGKTPARQVELAITAFANGDMITEQKKLCLSNENRRLITPTLFPNQKFLVERQRFVIWKKDMGLQVPGGPELSMHKATIVGCAHYRESLTEKEHFTPFIVHLGVNSEVSGDKTVFIDSFALQETTIPKDRLGIRPEPVGLAAN
ncbi:hypothetical protein [Bradyrhizobium sp. SZCCHNR1082]|uniref:hypothetical protein n=1 Tax=Bradyrhizobium sp. SZCCHNR1082 TaxID=3057363 RepID=UPI002916D82B|nr:hypothetical protein [Bradyrhizobium sp. SZCCHNR1082]